MPAKLVVEMPTVQNEEEKMFLEQLSDSNKKIKTFSETDSFPPSSKKYKILNYKQNNIHR